MNDDEVVIPRESSQFGFYSDGSSSEVVSRFDLPAYSALGLDIMEEEGKVLLLGYPGDHEDLPIDQFANDVVLKYLQWDHIGLLIENLSVQWNRLAFCWFMWLSLRITKIAAYVFWMFNTLFSCSCYTFMKDWTMTKFLYSKKHAYTYYICILI